MALYKTYSKDQKKCAVTFELTPEAANGAEQVWLAGDFNSWSSIDTPMKKLKNGTFKVKLTLEAGKEYVFEVFSGKATNYTSAQQNGPDFSFTFTTTAA